jgi:hypothetical protein
MALDPGVWVTLADLKEHLDIDVSDTTKDSLLTNKLNSAWKNIVNYLGQDLTSQTYTEDYDGDGSNTVLLNQFPVISITSVYTDFKRTWQNSPFTPDSTTIIDPTTYFCDLKTGLLTVFMGSGLFPIGFGNIHIVYVAGYATVPYDAKDGLLQYAALMAQRAGLEGKVAQTLGGKSEQYDMMAIPLFIRQSLISYRKIPC